MSSFRDLVKKVNEEKKTVSASGQKQSTEKDEENGSSFRDLVRNVNNGTIKVGSKLNSSQVSDWYKGVRTVSDQGNSYLSKNGYRQADTDLASNLDKYLSQAADVGQYIRSNRNASDNYDEAIQNYHDTVSYLRSLQSGVESTNKYYSSWKDEDDYFKTSADTRADRQKKYADNQTRIKELQEEQKSAGYIRKNEIDGEIAALLAENRQYERGENGWVSKNMDDYYGHTSAEDFKSGSANRNIVNPTRETLDYYDVMIDNTQWYTDAHGNTYDAFGNKIDKTNVDAKDRIVHPMANDERFAVNDRLGMYLKATDDEVSEAVGMMDTA